MKNSDKENFLNLNVFVEGMAAMICYQFDNECYGEEGKNKNTSLFKWTYDNSNDFRASVEYSIENDKRVKINFSHGTFLKLVNTVLSVVYSKQYLNNEVLNDALTFSKPKNEEDRNLVKLLSESSKLDLCWSLLRFTSLFLLYHEKAHYVLGHLDYLIENSELREFNEIDYKNSSYSIGNDLFKVFELTADSFAFNYLFKKIKALSKKDNEYELFVGETRYNLLRLLINAITIVFSILEIVEIQKGRINIRHPEISARLTVLFIELKVEMKNEIEGLEMRNKYIDEISKDVNSIYSIITGRKINFLDIKELFSKDDNPMQEMIRLSDKKSLNVSELLEKGFEIPEGYQSKLDENIVSELIKFFFIQTKLKTRLNKYREKNFQRLLEDDKNNLKK